MTDQYDKQAEEMFTKCEQHHNIHSCGFFDVDFLRSTIPLASLLRDKEVIEWLEKSSAITIEHSGKKFINPVNLRELFIAASKEDNSK